MNDFWVYLMLTSLIFGFTNLNINEIKHAITKEVAQAVREAWEGDLDYRNIFNHY